MTLDSNLENKPAMLLMINNELVRLYQIFERGPSDRNYDWAKAKIEWLHLTLQNVFFPPIFVSYGGEPLKPGETLFGGSK